MSRRKPYTFAAPSEGSPALWKSLEERDDPEAHARMAAAEFPLGVSEAAVAAESAESAGLIPAQSLLGRRNFMSLTGGAAALLGLNACIRRPEEKILPYSRAPEYVIPGVPLHYATVVNRGGAALGLLVETHEGRPTKIEGNPDHPASLGGTDLIAQAMILDLYDPDRSSAPVRIADGKTTTSDAKTFFAELEVELRNLEMQSGEGLCVLMQPTNSPTVLRLRKALLAKFPKAKTFTYAPLNQSEAREGTRLALGRAADVSVDYAGARTIVAVDSDFLFSEPGSVRNARSFAQGRRLRSPRDTMNRLYVIESMLTVTGSNADHRLRVAARDTEAYLRALAKTLSVNHGIRLGEVGAALGDETDGKFPKKWLEAVAKDLANNRGRSAIVVGSRQPSRVHALACALNHALGNVGDIVSYTPVLDEDERDNVADIQALASELDRGGVKALFVVGGNPALDAPADLKFAEKLSKARFSVHLSSHRDETSAKVRWHVPRAHELEAWGDQVFTDGTLAIQQPLIAPLHGGISDIELLAKVAGDPKSKGYDLVRATFRNERNGALEATWKRALHKGVVPGSRRESLNESPLQTSAISKAVREGRGKTRSSLGPSNLEVVFAADAKLFDGRHANNQWLLELPDPMTRICWDNAALVSPSTAKALGVKSGDMVELKGKAGSVEIVAWVAPGQAEHSVALHLGWGRPSPGRYAKGHGFNVYPLRGSESFAFADGVSLRKLGRRYPISQTQDHHSMEGRAIAIDATLSDYQDSPEFAQYRSVTPKTPPLWREVEYKGHKWGMSVDLNACIGCNACAVACQSENNVAVVGKEQVARGREMHWLRIDRYYVGHDENDPAVAFQPVACVHCEEAPCENVCPVNATEHSPEGLNDMAYNRCIGTRYCANNCPYKVRRFNYLDYRGEVPETEKMQFNPNVTVRMRGVMEKCTYCVQRIEEARIDAKRNDRAIRDGDVVSACAQACPTEAIVFGDLNDSRSQIASLAKLDRGYKLLGEIGTQPRTTYLAKIRNPNPEMVG